MFPRKCARVAMEAQLRRAEIWCYCVSVSEPVPVEPEKHTHTHTHTQVVQLEPELSNNPEETGSPDVHNNFKTSLRGERHWSQREGGERERTRHGEFRMSGGKKRSGFQITSVTSDFKQTPNDQSAPSIALTAQGSAYSLQGSSSQPTTPSLKRRYASHDASAQEAGCSRFRVVRLAVSGPGGGSGRGKPYHRGRWTCTEFMEREEVLGIRRVLDTMRHAHSLESLEMIGRDADRGGVHSQGATHLLCQPVKNKDSSGVVIHSGPPSPTHKGPVNVRLLDGKEPGGAEQLDSSPSSPPAHPRVLPPPLQLEAGRHGQHILRLSHSQPSSPPAGSNHLAPVRTPATFSLDQTFFSLTQDASSSANNLIAIDNKIEQAMDLVKSHLMLAVREEVELLKEQIRELQDKNQHLEKENLLLRTLTHDVPNTQNT